MRFGGTHTIGYIYSEPVFLEPHVLKLRPRCDATQRLESFSVSIEPEPILSTDSLDAHGNATLWAWFEGTHERLRIQTRFSAVTSRINPFDYIALSEDADRLPPRYHAETAALQPYLSDADEAVSELVRLQEAEAQGRLGPFLAGLTTWIYETCTMIHRELGDPWSPARTLAEGEGSCRDLAVLFMACCRHAGVAARFVSGYQEGDPDSEDRELHAWGEAYVPGGGWRGYDPSHGLVVTDRHLALASAADSAGAAAVSGSFRRTGAEARMETSIELACAPDAGP